MNVYTLMDDIVSGVASDATLSASCVIWYGRAPYVYIDHDEDNPPDQDDCPDIQFHSPEKKADEENREVHYGLYASVMVNDTTDATRTEDTASEFGATEKLFGMLTRIITTVRASKPAGFVMAYELETDTVSTFPVFVATIYFSFIERVYIGQDPLA